jgi:hypothetical protein
VSTPTSEIEGADELLRRRWGDAAFEAVPVSGGANNRILRVTCEAESVILKAYFRHPGDERDRQATEASFLQFARGHHLSEVPELFDLDSRNQLNLLEFIDGRRIESTEIDAGAVAAAASFFSDLNSLRSADSSASLPMASEASFSVEEHLQRAHDRVTRLGSLGDQDELVRSASRLVDGRLVPAYRRAVEWVREACKDAGVDPAEPLAGHSRCLSPADFGFHNALLTAEGRFRFIDFEYAGWDDPAKAMSDFFWQPGVPVPRRFLPQFAREALSRFIDPNVHAVRFAIIDPICALRWTCICLNEFTRVDSERRAFASPTTSAEVRAAQLNKADRYVEATEEILAHAPVAPW